MRHLMIDIEALGNSNDALVLSIGAATFDPYGDGPSLLFYRTISPEDAQKCGGKIDASTVIWWLQQDPKTIDALLINPLEKPQKLRQALHEFKQFVEAEKPEAVWANSPTFDCTILRSAFRSVGLQVPWGFREERCMRTLVRVSLGDEHVATPEGITFTPHNALDDARRQVYIVQAGYRALRD